MQRTCEESLKRVPTWVIGGAFLAPVLMNLLANKSIDFGVSWMALDCGTLVSWLAFLCMDLVTIQAGAKASIYLSAWAMIASMVTAALLAVAAVIPGTWGEAYELGSVAGIALDNTIAGNWKILLGSCIAYIISAVVNSLLNAQLGRRFNGDRFKDYAVRTYISTAIGQFVDNLVFALIVSVRLFGWNMRQCIMCSVTGAVIELVCEIIASPAGFKALSSWRRQE